MEPETQPHPQPERPSVAQLRQALQDVYNAADASRLTGDEHRAIDAKALLVAQALEELEHRRANYDGKP